MNRSRIFVGVCLSMFVVGSLAWAESPPREKVKEVKFHSGYKGQLLAIEAEACAHYESTHEFKVFQEVSNPRPGDIKAVNFGYSCTHPDNPRGGWIYLTSRDEIHELVGVTNKAKSKDVTDPRAGQVIEDAVHFGLYPYPKYIFPNYLPDDSSLEYKFWSYKKSRANPSRMEIHVYREGSVTCPGGLVQGRLADGTIVCYQYPEKGLMGRVLAWHDHTVFEKYSHTVPRQAEVTEIAPVFVDPPKPAVVTEETDNWRYEKLSSRR